jgi:hypothetical protein
MARVRIVRCYLRSPGEAPSLRFVPLREFNLWKYYMTHHHGKIVEGGETSYWVDAETYGSAPPQQARPLEPVVRVDLQYWDQSHQTANLVQRFFPLEEYDIIRDVFLRHFPDQETSTGRPVMRRRVSEVRGYFIRPRIPNEAEA